jgi:hypothetical protein
MGEGDAGAGLKKGPFYAGWRLIVLSTRLRSGFESINPVPSVVSAKALLYNPRPCVPL